MPQIETGHGRLALPAFIPDATRGVVKTIDREDLLGCGTGGLMVNSLHLASDPGASVISASGGIHRFTGWDGPILSDSGGFQILSVLNRKDQGSMTGRIAAQGITYRMGKGRRERRWSPEICIRKQVRMGADIIFCLDYCTHGRAARAEQERSVTYTIEWARRCREEFCRLLENGAAAPRRPLLFAVVQGGSDEALRRACAESLVEMGFDGYGFGGWPIDRDGGLVEMVELVGELLPSGAPRHALGIGRPENIVKAHQWGYDLFDCVIPTREARRGRLYVFDGEVSAARLMGGSFYFNLHMADQRYCRDFSPVDENCGCRCCRQYTRAYLRHLHRMNEPLAQRLFTVHNLYFYNKLLSYIEKFFKRA